MLQPNVYHGSVILVLLFLITLFCCPAPAETQDISSSISGMITDGDTNQPIPYVNVFLANTTMGASTDARGVYHISDIPAGIYTLVYQHIGYELLTTRVTLGKPEIISHDVILTPKIFKGADIEIVAETPDEWQEYLEIFKKEFLGETDNAFESTISNPEVLDFEYNDSTGLLTASTDSLLLIENLALGYDIEVVLHHFSCKPSGDWCEYLVFTKFSEFETDDTDIRQIWIDTRYSCFEGSMRHFLSTLPTHKSDEYFQLHQGTVKSLIMGFGEYITSEQISLFPEVNSPFLQLYFDEAIRVTYRTSQPNNQSIIELTSEHALIDSLGNLLTPLTITVHGRWSGKRIADTLPFDYNPEIYLKTKK